MAVETGTDMTLFIVWGDGQIDEIYKTDPTDFAGTLTHSFPEVGSHNVTFRVTNSRSEQCIDVVADVDIPIADLEVQTNHSLLNSPALFDLKFTAGTRVVVFYNYGDNHAEQLQYDTKANLAVHQYTYSSVGIYNVSVHVSNSLGCHHFTRVVGVCNSLTGVAVTFDNNRNLSETIQFTRAVTSGSHLTCEYYYGDDYMKQTYVEDPASASSEVVEHQYASPGVYAVKWKCYTYAECSSGEQNLNVEVKIVGLNITIPKLNYITNEDVVFTTVVDQGFPVTYSLDFADGQSGVPEARTNASAWEGVHSPEVTHAYSSPGAYSATVTAQNEQGTETASVLVTVEDTITGLDLVADKHYVPTGEPVVLTSSVTAGSNVRSYFTPGDGSPVQMLPHSGLDASLSPVTLEQRYNTPGNYTATVVANNTISQETGSLSSEIVVQDKVTDLTLTATTPVKSPPAEVTLTFALIDNSNPPTDPFIRCALPDSRNEDIYSSSLASGSDHVQVFTFADDMVGDRSVTCNVSNYVSWREVSADFVIQREITGVALSFDNDAAPVGGEIVRSLTMATGSHATIEIDWLDGTSLETLTHPNTLNSSEEFKLRHVYNQAQNYSIGVTVKNGVSELSVPSSDERAKVQRTVPTLSVTSNSPVKVPPGEGELTVSISDGPADNVHFKVDCGDGTDPETSYVMEFTSTTSVVIPHTFPENSPSEAICSVNASNLVSHQIVNATISLLGPIEGLTVSADNYSVATNEPAKIKISVEKGSDVTYNVVFVEGGQPESQEIQGTADGQEITFEHTYTNPDNYTVGVTASNPVSSVSKDSDKPLVVQNRVVKDDLVLEYPKIIPPGDVTFTLNVKDSQPKPTDMHVTFNYGDNNLVDLYVGDVWPLANTYTYEASSVGDLNATILCNNLVSSTVIIAPLTIQEKIVGASIEVRESVPINEAVEFTFTMEQGSHVSVMVDHGDSSELQEVNSPQQDTAKTLTWQHVYTNFGKYSFKATVKNDVTEEVIIEKTLDVDTPVKGLEADMEGPVGIPDGKGRAKIILPAGVTAPSGTIASFLFGDEEEGTAPSEQSIDLQTNTEVFIEHTFTSPGEYDVSLTVRNSVSEQSFDFKALVYEMIQGLSFDGQINAPGDVDPGGDKNIFINTGDTLLFTASERANVTYTWTIQGNDPITSIDNTVQHTFANPGDFEVSVEAKNPVDTQSVTRTVTVQTAAGIEGIYYNKSIYINSTLDVRIELTKVGPDMCFSYHFKGKADEVQRWAGTSEVACGHDESFDATKFVKIPAELSTTQYFPFTKEEDYEVTISLISRSDPITFPGHVTVAPMPCDSPLVSPKADLGRSTSNPKKIKKAVALEVLLSDFAIQLRCMASKTASYSWSLYRHDLNDGTKTQITLSELEAKETQTGLQVPRSTLSYGLYGAGVNVRMNVKEEVQNGSTIFVEVVSSNLTVSIDDQDVRLTGHGSQIEISAIYNDPDDPSDPHLKTVEWFCHRSDQDEPDLETGTGEACFGKGPFKMSFDTPTFVLDTALMQAGTDYVLSVKIYKDDRVAMANQTLKVSEGNPPELQFQCVANNCGKQKITVQQDYTVWGSCKDGQQGTFTWALTKDGTEVPNFLEKATITPQDGNRVSSLTIPAGFLEEGRVYSLELRAKVEGLSEGFGGYKLTTDYQPHGGTCTVSPTEGEALGEFTVACAGWKDDGDALVGAPESELSAPSDNDLRKDYVYAIKDSTTDPPTETTNNFYTDKPVLPPGDPNNDGDMEIRVTLTDSYGSYVTERISIKVKAPAGGEASIDLDNVDTSDPNKALSLFTAAAAMIEGSDTETTEDGSSTDTGTGSGTDTGSSGSSGSSGTSGSSGSSGSSGTSGISSGRVRSAAEIAAEEEQKKREAAQAEKERQKRLASVISSMATLAEGPALTDTQLVAVLGSIASATKKMTTDAPADATSSTLELMTTMSSQLTNLPEAQKQAAMNSLMDTMANSLSTVDKVDDTVVKEPPNPEAIPNDEQEEADAEEEERLRQEEVTLKQGALVSVEKTTTAIVSAIGPEATPDGPPQTAGNDDLQVAAFKKSSPEKLSNLEYDTPGSSIKLPEFAPSAPSGDNSSSGLIFAVVFNKNNLMSWEPSADDITSGVTTLSLTDPDEDKLVEFGEIQKPVEVGLDMLEAENNFENLTNATVHDDALLLNFGVTEASEGSAFVAEMKLPFITDNVESSRKRRDVGGVSANNASAPNVSFDVFMVFNTSEPGQWPNETKNDKKLEVVAATDAQGNTVWKLIVPGQDVHPPGFNIAIRPKVAGDPNFKMNMTDGGMTMRTAYSKCRSWDEAKQKWTGDSCRVGQSSSVTHSNCECTELTKEVRNFAGGVTLPTVNPIDFAYIFANFSALLAANPTVFAVIFSILGVYILLGIWVRRLDKKDVERWGVTPLIDNKPRDAYYFKVSVYTGLRQGAGTRSNVCFILSGDQADSGFRILADHNMKQKPFERNAIRHFVMCTETGLGDLTFLRVWHDNSGKGDQASWFLDKIVIEDLQSKIRYFFLCGRWLAVDEDDGQVNRILPVAGQEEVSGFQHLFFTTARKNITDEHLWISILSRPTKSNFTRLQRLTCCLTLLFTTMVANAMFYGSDDDPNAQDQAIRIGPFAFGVRALLVSIYSNLTVIPINVIVVQIFRKTRPKGYLDLDEMEEKQQRAKLQASLRPGETLPPIEKKKWWRRRYPLPYQWVYVGWSLALLSALASAFIVVFYSLEWGKPKSEEWLGALFLSFFQSVILIQPVKVVIIAMLVSCIFRKLDDEEESKEEIIQSNNAKPAKDEDLLDMPIFSIEQMQAMQAPKPLSQRKLEKARKKREYEKKVTAIIKEVVFYFCFLILVCFIAWGTKDDTIYAMNSHIKGLFDGQQGYYKASKVSDGFKFWEWCNETVTQVMYFDKWYSGQPTTRRERMFVDDGVTFRVGPARLRQLRVKPASCSLNRHMDKLLVECNEPYSIFSEEDRNFTQGWYLDPNNDTERSLSSLELSFKYFGMLQLRGLPYWGIRATYGGGGYVADLGTSAYKARKMVRQLKAAGWVDLYTRAAILEFTVYNPNINLFAYINFLMEFPATGGVLPSPRIMSFQVYHAMGGMGTFVLLCEILYILILVYFIVHEVLAFRKQRKAYFKEAWNIFEVCLIIVSILGVAMYALREVFGRLVMDSLKENTEAYTNYMQLAYYDETLTHVIGTIVFMANIKFLRLLRFNKFVVFLATTLARSGTELFYFGITFAISVIAYATLGNNIFGLTMYGFSSFINTLESLMSMLLGKFDFEGMEHSDRILGPIFFVTFVVFIFFIMINMILGIIGTTFYEVRMNPELAGDDYKVLGFIFNRVKMSMGLTKPQVDTGAGYVQATDALDARLAALDRMISDEYKRSTKRSTWGFESGPSSSGHDYDRDHNYSKEAMRNMKRTFGVRLALESSDI